MTEIMSALKLLIISERLYISTGKDTGELRLIVGLPAYALWISAEVSTNRTTHRLIAIILLLMPIFNFPHKHIVRF